MLSTVYAWRKTKVKLTSNQYIESKGIHIVPTSFLQNRFKNLNFHTLVQDNVAFKMSFGLTFMLAAFAEF